MFSRRGFLRRACSPAPLATWCRATKSHIGHLVGASSMVRRSHAVKAPSWLVVDPKPNGSFLVLHFTEPKRSWTRRQARSRPDRVRRDVLDDTFAHRLGRVLAHVDRIAEKLSGGRDVAVGRGVDDGEWGIRTDRFAYATHLGQADPRI